MAVTIIESSITILNEATITFMLDCAIVNAFAKIVGMAIKINKGVLSISLTCNR